MLVCKNDAKPLSREKGNANMTYFAFNVSKIKKFETLVFVLKMFKIKFPIQQYTRRYIFDKKLFLLEIDSVIFECLAPHTSKIGHFQTIVVIPNLFKIEFPI